MKSPLEDSPKILEKVGLFIVLFNLIDFNLEVEFVYIVNQKDLTKRPVLDFLKSQSISTKTDILENFTGVKLCEEIKEINEFRNHLGHGTYGANSATGEISNSKRNKKGKYSSIPLSEEILDKYIERERQVLKEFHELTLKRMGK